MKLITRIQELAADSQTDIGDVLRQCRILASRIDNTEFEQWVDHELSGYRSETVPDYRRARIGAFGQFISPFQLRNSVPIPALALEESHRHWAQEIKLKDPIGVFIDLIKREEVEFRVKWPADLISYYESHFYEGTFQLHDAWISVSRSNFVGIIDNVRNRVLSFALDLGKTFPDIGEPESPVSPLMKETAHQLFQITINGNVGNIAQGGSDFDQTVQVGKGDFGALKKALIDRGVPESALKHLESAIELDSHSRNKFGKNVKGWISDLKSKAASGAAQIAVATASTIVPKLIAKYFGLSL